ncbi:GmrSD restriction endonuclease domain-containing protein [Psychrobacter sp. ER1]|uniref:GmrSD restriction endonuclease domain-containing protein n=1 Tax=Psychrobacter sp. ER1 TaxID=3406645 RepID=UPI003B4336BC
MKDDIINIDLFKKEMKSRLIDSDRKGSLENKKGFINKAIELPVYNINKKVAKFLLLAAHHNAVEDPLNPGLLVKGKEALNSCLTSDMYNDERNLSLEHVAPQTYTNGWDQNIYARNTLVHTLGNLILVSSTLNSSLSNRVWNEKRNLYRAAGARTEEEAKQILIDSQRNQNFDFRNSTKDVIEAQSYMPNLVALSKMEAPWTAEWIEKRSQHLYSLVWEELMPWLS